MVHGTDQGIAHWLTDLENPQTQSEYANNVILKRFAFESFDCYFACSTSLSLMR